MQRLPDYLLRPHHMAYVSAFAGLATMIALSPLPGYLTSFMHGIQASKMKKVRVT